jgi:hypothetical protein
VKNVNNDARQCEATFSKQRYKLASVCVGHDDVDLPSNFTIASGPLPGDKIASDFSRVFRSPGKTWTSGCSQLILQTICPLNQHPVDTSKTIYADDFFNVIVVQGAKHDDMKQFIDASNSNLSQPIPTIGLAQNTKKQEIAVSFCGTNSLTTERVLSEKTNLGVRIFCLV